TGKHYNYFRDYDPAIGRYLESDPIGIAGGANTYSYVRGRALTRIDPTGLREGSKLPLPPRKPSLVICPPAPEGYSLSKDHPYDWGPVPIVKCFSVFNPMTG